LLHLLEQLPFELQPLQDSLLAHFSVAVNEFASGLRTLRAAQVLAIGLQVLLEVFVNLLS